MSGGDDFGEHLADMAADGYDVAAPVPYRPVRAARFSTITGDDFVQRMDIDEPVPASDLADMREAGVLSPNAVMSQPTNE